MSSAIKSPTNDKQSESKCDSNVSEEELEASSSAGNVDKSEVSKFILELDSTSFQKMKRHPRFPKTFNDDSTRLKRSNKKKKKIVRFSQKELSVEQPQKEQNIQPDVTQEEKRLSPESDPDDESELDDEDIGALPKADQLYDDKKHGSSPDTSISFPYPFLPISQGGIRILDGVFDPRSLVEYTSGFMMVSPKAFNTSLEIPGYPSQGSDSSEKQVDQQGSNSNAVPEEEQTAPVDLAEENRLLKEQNQRLIKEIESLKRARRLGNAFSEVAPEFLTPVHYNLPFLDRKFLSLPKWHCIPRPQYKASCGVCSLTATFNFLFSVLGTGSLPPLTVEQVIAILGIPPPFDTINYGKFTGNATIMTWFHTLLRHFKLNGRCVYLWKASGGNKTVGVTRDQALNSLKESIRSDKSMIIYHWYVPSFFFRLIVIHFRILSVTITTSV